MSLAPVIAGHALQFTPAGHLRPWAPWRDILARVMTYYRGCPVDHGYPRFASEPALDANWQPDATCNATVPALQNGTGILSYLAYRRFAGDPDGVLLSTACGLGRYLTREALTPADGVWPRFTRSTGRRSQWPLAADCGAPADLAYEVQPDKGALAGYALLKLWEIDGSEEFLAQALHNAALLTAHQQAGAATHSPWPFRIDYRDGTPRGPVSGNASFTLRLYETLLEHGHAHFAQPQAALWDWVRRYQLPSAAADGALFAQFFEDQDTPGNRSAWAPLNLARYLLERSPPDLDALAAARTLIDFVEQHFTRLQWGVRVCHGQDQDPRPWNGINCTYGAVLARYAVDSGSAEHYERARDALNFSLHCIDESGRPHDLFSHPQPGGRQQDAHTDVVHNVLDALTAFPEWA